MNNQHKDLLIVGQGIAGTLLAWHAQQSFLTFDIIDRGSNKSASATSSGIINPITGPKYVKSWMIDKLLPCAHKTYNLIGDQLNARLVRGIEIARHIPHIEAENIWDGRILEKGYRGFLAEPKPSYFDELFTDYNRFGIVRKALLVDVANLLIHSRELWQKDQNLIVSEFQEDALERKKDGFRYMGRSYSKVILAMGHDGTVSKLFPTSEYTPVKGEVLLCRIDKMPGDRIFKKGKFIVPLGENLFWVGSNYQHQFKNQDPDPSQIKVLLNFLQNDLAMEYEIIDHKAGIRPSTRYRRPFIGAHPTIKGLYLFNGLGTKGISLAPYFSYKLIQSIHENRIFKNTEAFNKAFKTESSRKAF